MIDATRLLDMVMGAAGQPSTGSVPATRSGYGAERQAGSGQQGGDLLEQAKCFLQNQGGGIVGGVAAGALTSLLLGSKGGREIAGEALKLGAAAAVGGLAYKAYTNYRDGKALIGSRAAEFLSDVRGATLPGAPPANEHAILLLRAMFAAALSDGVIDVRERERILVRLAAAGINSEEQQFLEAEFARPLSPAQLAAAATTPEMKSEIYLASSFAIDADTGAERAYLSYLAATLGLNDALVAHLEAAVSAAKAPAASPAKQVAAG